ncbi:Uncharacterised protein [Salmonella enterica subsp. enterica serovar Typhimurium str. DT104]|uniref:hypothetical protein n=1 Tax=Salmonella enterica TaxID=28901 RepID=UPI0005E1E51E|nr:hypothetical protein [Salmonella enterica]CQB46179.1 Uncharacterised protein [Salmonella enterica subsp. enterica serovar Typhimurium str. DT104]
MQVKSLGFSITNENENINTIDVMNEFIKASSRQYDRADYTRRILMSDVNDFYYGLVVTFKNQKKNCKSQFIDGKFQLKVEDLQGDEKLATFNLFLLNKTNLRGLYMSHHGSCSLNTLFSHLQSVSNEFIRKQNAADIVKLGDKPKQKEVTAVNKKHKKRFSFSIMTTKEDIKTILGQFREIKKASFKFDYIDFKGGPMTPLEAFANSTTIDMCINPDDKYKIGALSQTMSDAFNAMKGGISKARVTAIDHSGIEKIIDFMDCPAFFESYDFDVIAEKVNGLTNDNYTSNPVFDIIKDEILNGANKNAFV